LKTGVTHRVAAMPPPRGAQSNPTCAAPLYPHEIITTDGTLGLAACSLTNNEAFVMMKKRVSLGTELPLERRWLSKVRRVVRKARNSRERAEVWGNELTHYLSRLSL